MKQSAAGEEKSLVELEKQNEQIGRITGKAEMNHGRIDGANERANKILAER